MNKRRVWTHRAVAATFTALALPAFLWWRDSVLFVIAISLVTQVSASLSAAEAADDRALADRLDRIEALLRDRPAG